MPKNPRISPTTLRIELLAFPEVQLLDVAGPLQVFATANRVAGEDRAPYSVHVVSQGGGIIASSSGVALMTEALPTASIVVDTLIVAGGPGVEDAAHDAALLRWVDRRARGARRFGSVCTGAVVLASAGLLEGRRATSHWSICAALARRFPGVSVEPDLIFVQDGPAWTSAGVTAGIDLALAWVEADLGRAVALAVARHLVVFLKRPGGQAQFSARLGLQQGERFEALHGWMADNLVANLSLPALARQAGMSERSFSRHYQLTTGETPARAVERLRVEAGTHPAGRHRTSGEAGGGQVRLWVGRNDAAQLPAPGRCFPAGLPRAVWSLNEDVVRWPTADGLVWRSLSGTADIPPLLGYRRHSTFNQTQGRRDRHTLPPTTLTPESGRRSAQIVRNA